MKIAGVIIIHFSFVGNQPGRTDVCVKCTFLFCKITVAVIRDVAYLCSHSSVKISNTRKIEI